MPRPKKSKPAAEWTPGCGVPLRSTDRHGQPQQLPCGDVDDFGKRQFCHSCNARLFHGYGAQGRNARGAR